MCVCALSLQPCPTLCNPWTVTCQAPLSMGFSRQEYCSGLPFPSPGDLPDPGLTQPKSQCGAHNTASPGVGAAPGARPPAHTRFPPPSPPDIITPPALVPSVSERLEFRDTASLSLCSVAQLCLTLRHHGLPARLLCPQASPGKNTGVDCHSLLQGIFLTQVLNPGLLHCRRILEFGED